MKVIFFLFFSGPKNYEIFSIKIDCAKLVLLLNNANKHKITNDPGKLAYQAHPTTIIYQPIVCVARLASNRETKKKSQQAHLELLGINTWIYLIREGLKISSLFKFA